MNVMQFQKDLIAWYQAEKRDLPWRQNKDAYRIWISEVMLQQTRVDTVIPYFNRFIEQFPTMADFAAADEEQFLKMWEGLGYYSRVRNLHHAVCEVVSTYGGVVPDDVAEMKRLKGVGDYTAGAVASIAYDRPVPAVDGNVMRVYSRLFEMDADIALSASKKLFEQKVAETISHDDPSSFNQAIMELGALICTPSRPQCLTCPVEAHCRAYEQGKTDVLPVKSKKKKAKNHFIVTAVITNHLGEVLIEKRPEKGLLAGLWQFPSLTVDDAANQQVESVAPNFAGLLGFSITDLEQIVELKHVFTHLIWNMIGYSATCERSPQVASPMRWVSVVDVGQYTLPVPHQKVFAAYLQKE